MRTFGWFIVAAAVAMHFSYYRWDESSYRNPELGFLAARTENRVVAGVMGLVFPLLMAGGGAWMIVTGQKRADLSAKSK